MHEANQKSIILGWTWEGKAYRRSFFEGQQVTLGRLKDNDIVLPSPTVSRQHAEIYSEQGQFFLRNLSQTNWIVFNGSTHLQSNEVSLLTSGDSFRLGPVEIKVQAIESVLPLTIKIKCSTCGRISEYDPEGLCAWCGAPLAAGQTIA